MSAHSRRKAPEPLQPVQEENSVEISMSNANKESVSSGGLNKESVATNSHFGQAESVVVRTESGARSFLSMAANNAGRDV